VDADEETIARGTGNLFADLGHPDAEGRQTKLRLAQAINALLKRRRLTQAAAAARMGITQPRVSALANYRLDGFWVERLMTFLTAPPGRGDRHPQQATVVGGRADHRERGFGSRVR